MNDELPSYAALRYTVLEGLQRIGGPATNEQIDTWVKESPVLALSPSAIGLRHKGGRMSEIEYRVAWSRTSLKSSGLINSAGRGSWQITASGRQVSSIEALKELEKSARRGRRRRRGSKAREATRGSGANQRRWPDIVGYEDRTRELDGDVKHLASTLGANATRLWSVEVKLDLDIHNVRDAYYQTMMNSGWANVAYLAAWQINSDAEQEARELWERQGVGLIHIRAGRPEKSRILIHAREREGLDWRAVDRLTRENEDFRRFVRDVR